MRAKFISGVLPLELAAALSSVLAGGASAGTASDIDYAANGALNKLYRDSPSTKDLAGMAKGILVFPDITIKIDTVAQGDICGVY